MGHFGRVRAKVRINILNLENNLINETSWFELRTCDEHGESFGSRQEIERRGVRYTAPDAQAHSRVWTNLTGGRREQRI